MQTFYYILPGVWTDRGFLLNWIPTEPGLCYQLGKNIKISFAGQKIPVKTSTYLTNYRYKKIMAPEEIFFINLGP